MRWNSTIFYFCVPSRASLIYSPKIKHWIPGTQALAEQGTKQKKIPTVRAEITRKWQLLWIKVKQGSWWRSSCEFPGLVVSHTWEETPMLLLHHISYRTCRKVKWLDFVFYLDIAQSKRHYWENFNKRSKVHYQSGRYSSRIPAR